MSNSFNVGDHIAVRPKAKDSTTGEILGFRHAVSPANGAQFLGCDVLLANGKTQFRYMHDIARDNPDRLHMLMMHDAAQDLLAALKNITQGVLAALREDDDDAVREAFRIADAAIAKAEGRSNG